MSDKRTYSTNKDGKKYTWDVKKLWVLAAELKPFEYSISSFKDFDKDCWFGDRNKPTVKKVLDHHNKILSANLDYPIIISEDGEVMDGIHRICKAFLENKKTIMAIKFEKDPPADEVENLR